MSQKILETKEATMRFGGVVAVDSLNIHIDHGEIVAIIGPNGAGKTTAFNMITGVYTPTEGSILFQPDNNAAEGVEPISINGKRPDIITSLGIARTFQNIRLFGEMSVLENVMIACHLNVKSSIFTAMLGLPKYAREERELRQQSIQLLERCGLTHELSDKATSLPYGKQRRLEIARALATKPKLLLLDEPAAGMNPTETMELTQFVREIQQEFGLTILLIEHHMQIVMDISDRIYVLDFGKTIASGLPHEIQNNERVIEAYLGVSDEEGMD
jgi:branched-chain amino acid transport system ATP-binding protein